MFGQITQGEKILDTIYCGSQYHSVNSKISAKYYEHGSQLVKHRPLNVKIGGHKQDDWCKGMLGVAYPIYLPRNFLKKPIKAENWTGDNNLIVYNSKISDGIEPLASWFMNMEK